MRAKWFVQQNKIKLNIENKYFEVTDEKDYVHIVRLLPTQYCSCLEKHKCCHIFAVLHSTGMDIDTSFKHGKMTDLSKLIQKRNGGPSGRKMRGHLANSQNPKAASKELTNKEAVIDKSQNKTKRDAKQMTRSDSSSESESECDSPDKFYFIRHIIKKEYRVEFEKKLSPSRSQKNLSQTLINLEMVQENFEKLNDHFLEFDINEIAKYFDKKAWQLVKHLYNEKKVHSLCSICNEFCKSSCICCTTCSFWYHYKCAGVSAYHQKGIILLIIYDFLFI